MAEAPHSTSTGADAVFVGTLTEVEQTNPGNDDVIGSGDPVFYTFYVDENFKGDTGGGELGANLCSGTSVRPRS